MKLTKQDIEDREYAKNILLRMYAIKKYVRHTSIKGTWQYIRNSNAIKARVERGIDVEVRIIERIP